MNDVDQTTIDTPDEQDSSFQLREVGQTVVLKAIHDLNTTYSKDIYNLDTAFLKKYSSILAQPLTHLINISIKSGQFPDGWKTAQVIPLLKSGDAEIISNYRPISLLPVFSKVLEKIVSEQLMHHLETNHYLHPLQFGFRHNHSTESATCLLTENIKHSLNKGHVVGAVFLDLKKAFDTVNHDILISKPSKFNLSKQSLSWFDSYLKGREQCVTIHSVRSTFLKIETGIPQGTVLGPILFSLYINDLPDVCPDIGLQMYADDTVVYASGKTCTFVAEKLNANLDKISTWLSSCCLILNTKKTNCVLLHQKTTSNKPPEYKN